MTEPAFRPLAIVTGGWRRIGAAVASRLAAAGWDLVLHAHHPAAFDDDLAARLADDGARVYRLSGDLADAGFAASLAVRARDAAGRAAALLVNSASIFRDDDFASLAAESLHSHFAVNLFAPLLATQGLVASLDGGEGAVVNIVDQRVVNPVPDQLSYGLSKQALHASVRTLAKALAPKVRVNAVAPGLILPTEDYDPAQWERLAAIMPLRHLPSPDAVADAVAWLAAAKSVTGQTIFVDAGANLASYGRDFVHLEK